MLIDSELLKDQIKSYSFFCGALPAPFPQQEGILSGLKVVLSMISELEDKSSKKGGNNENKSI